MFESGKTTLVLKKSYEIAYALCRIAAKIPEKPFADALINEGIKVLGFAAGEEYGKVEKSLAAVEYLIKLGTGVGSINFMNSEVVLDEIALFNEVISGLLNAPKTEPADLSGVFTKLVISPDFSSSAPARGGSSLGGKADDPRFQSFPPKSIDPHLHEDDRKIHMENNKKESGNNPAKSGNENSEEIIELLKSGNRQGAILEKIRQSGNCRIKDIQDLLPECSERTLRYDLQSLAGQNLIEKIGTGGPAVFYRSRG